MPLSPTVALARDLIRQDSVTPNDNGCQAMLTSRLNAIGFSCEHMDFAEVSNLWATRGDKAPILVFAGHTDVVPTGPLEQWRYAPFDGEIHDGMLHGRGAADMKGSIACFVTACERFVGMHPQHRGSIGLLITSDEEGIARWGTREVMAELAKRDQKIDMCIVGEPTSVEILGDMAKIGRRGSLNGTLKITGKQGHIAYPHLANNPLHIALPALNALTIKQWDQGNENFQPTSFQISNINGGTGATNVIPGHVDIKFNFRYSPETTAANLISEVEAILNNKRLEFEIDWGDPGLPYETKTGDLVKAVEGSILEVAGVSPKLSTSGGTSDGRFIAPTGTQVVELGPVNATIHQINEHISTQDLNLLSQVYEKILEKLLL